MAANMLRAREPTPNWRCRKKQDVIVDSTNNHHAFRNDRSEIEFCVCPWKPCGFFAQCRVKMERGLCHGARHLGELELALQEQYRLERIDYLSGRGPYFWL